MPAQVLVMCDSCRRPQFAVLGGECVACRAPLPPAPVPRSMSERDRLIEVYQPFFEGDFGHGKLLLLSQRQLQWRSPRRNDSVQFELPNIHRLELQKRPVWESLLIPVLASVIWLSDEVWLKAAWVVLLVWGVAACLLQRRYFLGVTLKTGRQRRIFLDHGRRNAPPVRRIWSIWESLVPELSRLSVDARPR